MQEIEETLALAQEAISLAEELIYLYASLYGDLATETLILLQEVEQLLAETTELIIAINDILIEVEQALDQGMAISPESINQILTLVEEAGNNAAAIQTQTENWLQDLQAELEARAAAALSIPPTEIPTDRREAIKSAYGYVETVRAALVDSKISQEELSAIAQAGANAAAGLTAQGGPQLEQLAGSLNDITAKIAGGQLPDVASLLAALESSLPALPSLP